jgi:hypothetical protein
MIGAPDWLTPELIIAVLLFVVAPFLLIWAILYVVISMRQLKDAVAWLAWRQGGPAPPQRGNVLQFRRRSS